MNYLLGEGSDPNIPNTSLNTVFHFTDLSHFIWLYYTSLRIFLWLSLQRGATPAPKISKENLSLGWLTILWTRSSSSTSALPFRRRDPAASQPLLQLEQQQRSLPPRLPPLKRNTLALQPPAALEVEASSRPLSRQHRPIRTPHFWSQSSRSPLMMKTNHSPS